MGRDQLNRLMDAHSDSKLYKQELDLVKEAEVAEAIHSGEWNIYLSHKVNLVSDISFTNEIYATIRITQI